MPISNDLSKLNYNGVLLLYPTSIWTKTVFELLIFATLCEIIGAKEAFNLIWKYLFMKSINNKHTNLLMKYMHNLKTFLLIR